MPDKISEAQRSYIMSRIRSSETKPEQQVRSALHARGFRFRKNVRGMPGTPDIVLPKYGAVVEVRGCFWHRHEAARCRIATVPASNVEFWAEKFARNVERDRRNAAKLRRQGWRVLVVWECDVRKDIDKVADRLERFLLAAD